MPALPGDGTLVRAILANVAEPLLLFDEAGRIVGCNPAAERLFGYPADEVIGQPRSILLGDAYPREPLPGMARRRPASTPDLRGKADYAAGFRHEWECRRRDGSTFPAEARIVLLPFAERLWYVASVRDVAGRRAAEATLARQAALLREQAQLLDLTHDALITCDMLGLIVSWNPGAVALYGWTSDEARDRPVHELLASRFPESPGAAENQLLRSGSWEGALRQERRDGVAVIVASRWAIRRDPQGVPVGIAMANRAVAPH